jgi:hypothetical protein
VAFILKTQALAGWRSVKITVPSVLNKKQTGEKIGRLLHRKAYEVRRPSMQRSAGMNDVGENTPVEQTKPE